MRRLRCKGIENDKVDRGLCYIKTSGDEDDKVKGYVEAIDKQREDDASSSKAQHRLFSEGQKESRRLSS